MKTYTESVTTQVSIELVTAALDKVDYAKGISLFSYKLGLFDTLGWRQDKFEDGTWKDEGYRRSWEAIPFPGIREFGEYTILKTNNGVKINYTTNLFIPWYHLPFLFFETAIRKSMRESLDTFCRTIICE